MNKANITIYEAMKQHWIASHPNASPTEYQNAMKQIAKVCKV